MSIGLRSKRFSIYTLTETTTDGVVAKAYHLLATRWGRLVPPSGREATLGLGAEHYQDGFIAFADEVTVTEHDVIVDESDVIYEVRAVLPRPMLREVHVVVERSRLAQPTYYLVAS